MRIYRKRWYDDYEMVTFHIHLVGSQYTGHVIIRKKKYFTRGIDFHWGLSRNVNVFCDLMLDVITHDDNGLLKGEFSYFQGLEDIA